MLEAVNAPICIIEKVKASDNALLCLGREVMKICSREISCDSETAYEVFEILKDFHRKDFAISMLLENTLKF